MAKTTVPGLYIADSAITAAKLNSTLDLTGKTITVATASSGDNDTTVASTAFVQQEIASLVDSSPSALNTLNELAAAIGDDANFSTTITNSIATKLALAGGTMTGDLIINTTGALQIPVGTTAQRPTAAQGQLRFNTTTSKPEIYNGSAWADVGGGVESVNSATGVVTLDTDDISEGSTNLYFTNARADARIAAATTDDLSEGSTNLYFTTTRANSAIDGRLSGSTGVTVSNGSISIGQDVATSTSPTFQNLTLSGTDSIKVPSGTTAQRSGSPANGMLRYNSSTNEFEGYANSAWGAIGGDTTSSVDLYTVTGDGTSDTYDTGKNPQSENNTWVFIGGVYQPKSTYSYSGTEITLSENLPNGEDLEVITGTVSTYNPTDAILGQFNTTTSNTASYDTSLTTENENNVFVFIDGVYQPKSSYTYSGSTLTLDATPTSGMSLEVLVTRSMNAATVTTGFLADDAVTTAKITDANVTADKLASSLDLTGKTVTVATASAGDNDTSVASTAFVRQEITSLVDSAPAAMDTLNELAAALGDDANFSTTVNASIAAKLPLAGGTLTGDLNFGDSDKAIFGAGNDLKIYHDGNHSYIDEVGTGRLYIRAADNITFTNADGSETYANFSNNGAVGLRYDNQQKIITTSSGIDVTGTVVADGLTVDTSTLVVDATNNRVGIGTSSPDSLLHLHNTSQNSYIHMSGGDSLGETYGGFVRGYGVSGEGGHLELGVIDNATKRVGIEITQQGNEIIFDTAGTERMRIDSSGNVGIGQTSPNNETNRVSLELNDTWGGVFQNSVSGTPKSEWRWSTGGATVFGSVANEPLAFTTNNTERMRIDSSGNVGIGTTNPLNKLSVVESNTSNYYNRSDATAVIQDALPTLLIAHDGNSTNDYAELRLGNNQTTYYPYSAYIRGVQNSGIDRYRLEFGTSNFANATTKMTINELGNVGIGTVSPENNLHIFTNNGDEGLTIKATGDTSNAIISDANRSSAGAAINQLVGKWNGTAVTDIRYVTGSDTTNKDNGQIKFFTASAGTTTERMVIDDEGNVGIGTSGPIGLLTVDYGTTTQGGGVSFRRNSSQRWDFYANSGGNALYSEGNHGYFGTSSAHNLVFVTSETERMRIDTEGNISFGGQKVDPNWSQFFNAISGNYGGHLSFQNNGYGVTALGNNYYINNSTLNERVLAQPTQVFKLDHQGNFLFESAASGTAGATFSFTEKMRLDVNGNLLINQTSSNLTYGKLQVSAGGETAGHGGIVGFFDTDASVASSNLILRLMFLSDPDATGGVFIRFSDSNSTLGQITAANGTQCSYGVSSDERLKENIVDASSQLDLINNIRVREFDWKVNGYHEVGMIAQELNTVVPSVVQEGGEDVTEEPWSVDYGKLTPYLIKAVQELKTELDAAKARITELEG